jgi:hypothetical protein
VGPPHPPARRGAARHQPLLSVGPPLTWRRALLRRCGQQGWSCTTRLRHHRLCWPRRPRHPHRPHGAPTRITRWLLRAYCCGQALKTSLGWCVVCPSTFRAYWLPPLTQRWNGHPHAVRGSPLAEQHVLNLLLPAVCAARRAEMLHDSANSRVRTGVERCAPAQWRHTPLERLQRQRRRRRRCC